MAPNLSRQPLVSVVLRSIGRPSINQALLSVENQDYRSIEVIVVNARAEQHPALTDALTLPIHLVESDRDLTRPQAANIGLDHCQGKYIIFLDDDDYFEYDHISSLLACLNSKPDHLVAYADTRVLGTVDELRGELKSPFNRHSLLRENYIQIGAALFSAQLLAFGCRFDEEMVLFQDWDFWIQACQWTAFAHSGKATANWRAFSGGSGAGLGNNFEPRKNNAYKRKVHEKWFALRSCLFEKNKYAVERGRQLMSAGRLNDAQKWISSAKAIASGKLPADCMSQSLRVA